MTEMARILNSLKNLISSTGGQMRAPDRRTVILFAAGAGLLLLGGIVFALILHTGRPPARGASELPSGAMDLVRPIRASDVIVPPLGLGRPAGDFYLYSEPDVPWPADRVEALWIDTDGISADILRDMNEALLREMLGVPPP